MKTIALFAVLLVAFGGSGCIFGHHHSTTTTASPGPKGIITPDASLVAKVVSINTVGRFVVLSFPPGQMPKIGQSLFLYAEGLKTAEVKVTGPQQDNNIVADLVSGEAHPGDTVRDQ